MQGNEKHFQSQPHKDLAYFLGKSRRKPAIMGKICKGSGTDEYPHTIAQR